MNIMNKRWTRRRFLETSLKGSIVVGSGVDAGAMPATRAVAPNTSPPVSGLTPAQRELLHAVMDQIIPAADGMPAASEVGGVEYLARLAPQTADIKADLEKSLTTLQELSTKQLGKDFAALSPRDRVEVLKKLEEQQPDTFGLLRDYVYESYYTQPEVWKLIGYEFYPTNAGGPKMKPFDESVLAKVKMMPKLYREAP
jgi:hypothetical protein